MNLSTPHPSNTIIVIPARMASSGLPGKPLADICGLPMIVRVWQCAIQAKIGKVLVAADRDEIVQVVKAAGGDAIRTRPSLATSYERVVEALDMRDGEKIFEYVVALPGNIPLVNPKDIRACLGPFLTYEPDITTLVSEIKKEGPLVDENIIKAIASFGGGASTAIATDFVRKIGDDIAPPFWAHLPLFGWKRSAIEKFVTLSVSSREKSQDFTLLRALDNNMSVAVSRVSKAPFRVGNGQDLERVRGAIAAQA